MRQRAAQPVQHDHLFHTVLGLLDVQTQVQEKEMDLSAPCRH
jgi:lipid A ethanolaminephosphotransferase